MNLDLEKIKSIHFVGIKGVAMAALAVIAKEKRMRVTGSDVSEEFPTDQVLRRYGIDYNHKFMPQNLPNQLNLVVYTGAHQGIFNPEVQRASTRGVMVMSHAEALGLFMQNKRGITIAGSHGKTTTSAMIAHMLTKLGKDPSFAVGCGEITSLKTAGHWGTGEYFVAEGDEYVTDPTSDMTPRFMWQKPEILVVTNIDFDHPDVYKNIDDVKKVFVDFTNSLDKKAVVIINIDNENSSSVIHQLATRRVETYGLKENADFRLHDVSIKEGETNFEISHDLHTQKFTLKIPGVHNAVNATGAVAALVSLGFKAEELVGSLSTFAGTKRRFELVVEKNGKIFLDDYAHHPAEIMATLKAARSWYPQKRIIAIFQPHTYSRTQALLNEFAGCFTQGDRVLLTDIYASARETPIPGISGRGLYEAVKKRHAGAYFTPEMNSVLQWLKKNSRPDDLILAMGAGDIFTWLPYIEEIL